MKLKKWQKRILMSTALLGAVAPLVEPVTSVEANSLPTKKDNKGTYYALRPGDTLWYVYTKTGVSANQLAANSGVKANQASSLQVGFKVYIELNDNPKVENPDEPAPPVVDPLEELRKEQQRNIRYAKNAYVPPSTTELRRTNNNKVSYKDNFSAIAPTLNYVTNKGDVLPLMMDISPQHPNYAYYKDRGMFKMINGKAQVIAYLQLYKDNYYYYSPIVRYYDNDMKDYYSQQRSQFRDEVFKRIAGFRGGIYLPTHNRIEQDLRENSIYRSPRGTGLSGTGASGKYGAMNYYATTMETGYGHLNHDAFTGWRIGYGQRHSEWGQHNFRRYTAKPFHEAPITRANMTLSSSASVRHPDMYQRNRAHVKTSNGQTREGTKQTYRWGEYRYLGYLGTGEAFWNPNMPADGLGAPGTDVLSTYDFEPFPWLVDNNHGVDYHTKTDEEVFQLAMHNGWFGLSKNGYNSHIWRKYYDDKRTPEQWALSRQEYDRKYEAMRRIYSSSRGLQNTMRRPIHGSLTGHDAIHALTVKYGSLYSYPTEPDNVVVAAFVNAVVGPNTGGQVVRYGLTLTVEAEEGFTHAVHDTRVVEQKVYKGNELIQTFTRGANGNGKPQIINADEKYKNGTAPELEPGDKLTVKTNVKIFEGDFRDAMHGELQVHSDSDGKVHTNERTVYLDNRNSPIRERRDNVFTHTYTVPNPDDDEMLEIHSYLDRDLYINSFDMFYDSYYHNATNTLKVIADKGNFVADTVQLVDENGRVLSANENPIPGHTYRIRYNMRYISTNGKDARRYTELRVDHNIGRQMVGTPIHGREDSGTLQTNTITMKPKHNQVYSLETQPFVFETGQFDTVGQVVVGFDRYDMDKTDNRMEEEWTSIYDIEVSNVRVVPNETINTQTQMAEMLVQFDVDYNVPSDIKNIGQDVAFAIDLDGKTIYTKEHIRAGKNRNLSVPIQIELEGNVDKVIEANVLANYDLAVYEEGVYNGNMSNNYASGRGEVKNHQITPFYNSNRRRTWTQYAETNGWMGQRINYRLFNNGALRGFDRFTTPDAKQVRRINLYENYQIDAVRFRSRLTRQRGLGTDGWVNLLEEDGVIKAGYGYELEIDVSYNTNALEEDFTNRTGLLGRWTRPILTEPLLQDNIYVEMPDGDVRSVVGDSGTEQALRLKEKTSDKGRTTWTFEIDGGNVLGAETVGRFYIGEDVEDGRYPLNIFTPKIAGVSGKQTSATEALNHLLFDSAPDLGIVVDGSAVDDISDHINR